MVRYLQNMMDQGMVPILVAMSYGAITESNLRIITSDFTPKRAEETVTKAVWITYIESCNKDCETNQQL